MVVINGKEFESIEQAQEFLNSIREEEKVAEEDKKLSAIYEKRKAMLDEFLNVAVVTTFDEEDGESYNLICTLSNCENRGLVPYAVAEEILGNKYELDGKTCRELYKVTKVSKVNQAIKNFLVEECDWQEDEYTHFDNVVLNGTTYENVVFYNIVEGYDGSLRNAKKGKASTNNVKVKSLDADLADLVFNLLLR